MKIAICTDSNSGITQQEANGLGVFVLPMPIIIDGVLFHEDISLTHDRFYEKLTKGANISTSQPSPGDVARLWGNLLQSHDGIIHIPMSSGLSSSYATATMLSEDFEGRVKVIDNKRISLTQKQSVLDALALADAGYNCGEIHRLLTENAGKSSIYIMVDTFKHLKKGGRITPAAALLASVLNIKPVLQIQGERLDAYAKVKGVRQSTKTMIDAIKQDFETRFSPHISPEEMCLMMAYTSDADQAMLFKREIEAAFPGFEVKMDPLALSIACHIGPGALAIGCARKVPV